MRIFIAIVTVIMGALTGLYQAYRLRARKESLSELVLLLEEAAVYIRYNAPPVDELLKHLHRFEFIKSVSEYSAGSDNWRIGWEKAANDVFGLTADDRKLLVSVGKFLGNSDKMGQLAMLELNRNFFSARLSEAESELTRKAKMYRSVGLLMGIGMAVMIV